MDRRILIEICVADVESAIAAEVGGADRVELCDNLSVGGTTPSAGAIAEACRWLSIPVHVLIRPRAGDFVYSERELAVMRHDIEVAKALGASGVVLGVLTREGRIAQDQVQALVAMARPLTVTFHKAIDEADDPLHVLDALLSIGADRILSSGGKPTALDGIDTLKTLVDRAGNRIAVMAGGRLDLESLEPVIRQSRILEVHLGSAVVRPSSSLSSDSSEASWNRVDAQRVAAVVARVEELAGLL